jgi:hypothetical protein
MRSLRRESRADESLTIAFLRDPISRVKSSCQHVAEGKSAHLIKGPPPPETFDLDAFLNSGCPELFNLQTRILIETPKTASLDPNKAMTTAEVRDTAHEKLFSKVFRFGLQEHFDESLVVFAEALHWSPHFYVSLNKKSRRKACIQKSSY